LTSCIVVDILLIIHHSSFNPRIIRVCVGKNAKKAQNEMTSIWGKNEIFDELDQQQQQLLQ
jgi:hypothetical protein